MNSVPFNRVVFSGRELSQINAAVENGHISGDGPFTKLAERKLSEIHDGARVLLTPSCSHALELAARLMSFEPGDEIIVPSYTFVTSVSSFVANGATPVYCDIDPVTLGLDIDEVRMRVSDRTKAILLVHYGGVAANPIEFARLAAERGIVLIEDNAHGLGKTFGEKTLGTFGTMSTLSFHETKNITCGEGGALVLNNPQLVERAEILREKGTDRSRFFRGEVDKYTWQDMGSSWVLSDILAAILTAQLSEFDSIQARRLYLWNRYSRALSRWAESRGYSTQLPGTGASHLFYIVLKGLTEQRALIAHLKSLGVMAVSHYQPLHRSPFGSKFAVESDSLKVTDRVAKGLVRLPLFPSMTKDDQDKVIAGVLTFEI